MISQKEFDDAMSDLANAEAEIERLKALKTPASLQLLNITKGCLDDAEAETARLQGELHSVHAHLAHMRDETARLRDALSAAGLWRDMGEENARLRALLAEGLAQVDEYPDDLISSDWLIRARAALATNP